MKRRTLLKSFAGAGALATIPVGTFNSYANFANENSSFIKPKKLKPGDTVAVIAPGTAVVDPDDIARAKEALDFFCLNMKLGKNVLSGSGYKTRGIKERLEDLHNAFADSDVKAVISIRGGYGSPQLLDGIDYGLIGENPKVFIGYSDITALHLAIFKHSKLVTFHGPMPLASFSGQTAENFKKAVFSSEPIGTLSNPEIKAGIRKLYPTRTIRAGVAQGKLIGGNLSLISGLMGTPYEIETEGKILFLEDVGEQPFRIDRMLTQLRLAGKLQKAAGIVFGACYDCSPSGSQSSTWDLTLGEVLDNIIGNCGVPAFYGLMFGHTSEQITLPVGIDAILDSSAHTLTILESAVT